ncbi:hypothetical protein B0H19DRAFT_1058219 [Mycena capillaripes]|nr:hypothetical protein B0H19DRAFT_1058219 [Mycena capillaripes]
MSPKSIYSKLIYKRAPTGLDIDIQSTRFFKSFAGDKFKEAALAVLMARHPEKTLTVTKERRNSPTPSQCLANAMTSVGPTPVKCHEAVVMALAGCVRRPAHRDR